MVTMELAGDSGDTGEAACRRWESNLADMVHWVKDKRYFDAGKVGLFAYGLPAAAALRLASRESGLAYVIVNLGEPADGLPAAEIPVLFLQGTTDKIQIQSKPMKAEEIVRQDDPRTGSACILFRGADYFLYNIVGQAAEVIVGWLDEN
jgi:pimeloyl-ACP methyl ester carboxylesterase